MTEAIQDTGTEIQDEAPAIDTNTVADKLIRNCSLVSIGAGLFPIPVVDLAALGGVQVYLVRELCKVYGIPFEKERAKGILGAVAGGAAPIVVAPAAVALLKFIPGIGTLAAAAAMPGLSAASTLAIGRIFKKHFAAGGSLNDVDVEEMSAEYQEEVENAKDEAKPRKPAREAAATA